VAAGRIPCESPGTPLVFPKPARNETEEHPDQEYFMNLTQKEKLLRYALIAFGAIFCLVYPMGMVWPSGWVWHGGHGQYYLQMICGVYAVLGIFLIAAARDPESNRSLISFTIWSSVVHAGIMAAQAMYDGQEGGHLVGDVPALLLVAAVLGYLSPASRQTKSEGSHLPAQAARF
jgi:hypothetical protein